jgi:uncharacterized membrane protein YbhN (UPF0104 family)
MGLKLKLAEDGTDGSATVTAAVPGELAPEVQRDAHRLRHGLVWTAALVALVVAIGLAVPNLREVFARVSHARPGWVGAALALELASCVGYVATVRLVLSRAPARAVRRLAWAEMAFGAVVPLGGAGSLAVGAWAMRAWGVSWKRIADRSAVLFLLTSAINAAVLAIAGIGFWLASPGSLSGSVQGLLPAAVGVASLALFLALPRGGARLAPRRLAPGMRQLGDWVRQTERVAFTPHWRLLGAIGYLVFDIAVLWSAMRAFGHAPPIAALVLGYQVGYLANLVPIPGGIGALDGGLLAALLLYGMPAAPTAAAVLLYHAIALWLPTLGGTIGFARLRTTLNAPKELIQAPARSGADTPLAAELAA